MNQNSFLLAITYGGNHIQPEKLAPRLYMFDAAAYREANREKNKVYQKEYREKNKEARAEKEQLRSAEKNKRYAARMASDPEFREAQLAMRKASPSRQPEVTRERERAYRERNIEKVRRRYRDYGFRKRYGITIEERDALLAAQGGACACCGTTDPGAKKGWHVDHCHKGGQVRAILCATCNIALGQVNDSIGRLKQLITYLEKHSE
jgi:hypothetical protein